jgi:hypothetical protein
MKTYTGEGVKESDMYELVAKISKEKSIRVCSVEMLRRIGDQNGFTLAQGQ